MTKQEVLKVNFVGEFIANLEIYQDFEMSFLNANSIYNLPLSYDDFLKGNLICRNEFIESILAEIIKNYGNKQYSMSFTQYKNSAVVIAMLCQNYYHEKKADEKKFNKLNFLTAGSNFTLGFIVYLFEPLLGRFKTVFLLTMCIYLCYQLIIIGIFFYERRNRGKKDTYQL